MNEDVLKALQDQFNKERGNREAYRCMAETLESLNWEGAAKWMRKASNEEGEHADKFAGHIVDRNEVPRFDALGAPKSVGGDDLLSYFGVALTLEQDNTKSILALDELAGKKGDGQLKVFLIWAKEEQTRSERELFDIILMLSRLDNTGRMVFTDELGGQ